MDNKYYNYINLDKFKSTGSRWIALHGSDDNIT